MANTASIATTGTSLRTAYRLGLRLCFPDVLTGWSMVRSLGGMIVRPERLVRILAPIDYTRCREFEFALARFQQCCGTIRTVLDVSSPKLLPLTIAAIEPHALVTATDIVEHELNVVQAGQARLDLRNILPEVADVRALPYEDASFDVVMSVSVLEHVAPDPDGEIPAVREISRVLAPGGVAILTVPFARSRFSEFRQGTVYERSSEGTEPIFFQRFYDQSQLKMNLIDASGLELVELSFIEERFFGQNPRRRLAQYINASLLQQLLFGIWYYPLSRIFLSAPKALERCRKPYIACLVLRKGFA